MTDTNNAKTELVLTKTLNAPREKIFEAWTTPELLKQFFAPLPYTTPECRIDLRVGGEYITVMRDENGNDYPNSGVYLEIVPNEKLVFTDAFTAGWKPSDEPFMVASIELEDLGGGRTKYVARARHWSAEARERHEKMGFHEGWGIVADQLEKLISKK